MAALNTIVGANEEQKFRNSLPCPMPQSLVTPTARVPYSNAANIGECKTWKQSDRQTDHNTRSKTTGRTYVRSNAKPNFRWHHSHAPYLLSVKIMNSWNQNCIQPPFKQVAQLPQRPREPLSQLKSCQLLHNCTKNHIWLEALPFHVV